MRSIFNLISSLKSGASYREIGDLSPQTSDETANNANNIVRESSSSIAMSLNLNIDRDAEMLEEAVTEHNKVLISQEHSEPNVSLRRAITVQQENEISNGINMGISLICASLLLGITSVTFMKENREYATIPIVVMAVLGSLFLIYACVQKYRSLNQVDPLENQNLLPGYGY